MMIMPSEESERVYQVIPYIHSPEFFIQCDNIDSEVVKTFLM